MSNSSKASSVSATFGYDTINVMGFSLYTVKLRVKQFDLLRCFIEHKRSDANAHAIGLRSRLVESKTGKVYAYYEFATTSHMDFNRIKGVIDSARADVKETEATRLRMQNPYYAPDFIHGIEAALRRNEEPVYNWASSNDTDDLPF
jgi:hypothetical protein